MHGLTVAITIIASIVVRETRAQVNRSPQFLASGDMSKFSLREDTLIGSVVYTLRGLDPENQTIEYSISGDNLSVNRSSGVVTLIRPLDREKEDVLNVIVTIADAAPPGVDPNIVSLRRQVQVLDVNDNKPEFQDVPYSFRVPEDAAVGTTLFRGIRVTDADAGSNADIRLLCDSSKDSDACGVFDVRLSRIGDGKFMGIVRLKKKLDYELRSSYNIPLIVADQGAEVQLTSEIGIVADVEDLQDQPPVFKHAPYSVVVPENLPPSTPVLEFNVQDGDSGNWRPLKLTITSDPRGYFSLMFDKNEKGVHHAKLITTKNMIDREDPSAPDGLYSVQVKATEIREDGSDGDSASTVIDVIVKDADDQMPMFSLNRVELTVPESIENGVALPGLNLLVTDLDEAENAEFILKFVNVKNSEGVFSVFPTRVRGRAAVQIHVLNSAALDYEDPEKREFEFKIFAEPVRSFVGNKGDIPFASVRIKLSDANDNDPMFDKSEFVIDVQENIKAGHQIAQINATDKDSGEFGRIRYSVQGFGAEKFSVNPVTGQIFVVDCGLPSCLDYELRKLYYLLLVARDGGGRESAANLQINILDLNDNPPVFEMAEYRRAIKEGEAVFIPPLIIKAKDVDSGDNGKVMYSIVSGNTEDSAFIIEPLSGKLTAARPLSGAETETGRFRLTVEARDGGEPVRTATVNIVITVGTEGNDRPLFRNAPYSAKIEENAARGSVVLSLTAHDPDGDDNSIRFNLVSGAKDQFEVDHVTGVVTVSATSDLDREKNGPDYRLVVHAVDGGAPFPQTGTTTVSITVQDVNDEPPRFSRRLYAGSVSEAANVGDRVLQVSAADPDADSKLRFSMSDDSVVATDKNGIALKPGVPYDYMHVFRVDPETGAIIVNKPLDHVFVSIVTLQVVVEDVAATNGQQMDTADVTLYVEALNDDKPVFSGDWTPSIPFVNVSMDEELAVGTLVVVLPATDPLLNHAAITTYEKVIDSDKAGYFQVAASTGAVYTAKRMDFDSINGKKHIVQVRAVSSDRRRSSTANVLVTVQDVNDNSPEFVNPVTQLKVPEDTLPQRAITKFNADDADSNDGFGDVRYEVVGPSAYLLRADEMTGEIFVRDDARLDRETSDKINVTVAAFDTPQGGPLRRRTHVTFVMKIEDVNDNAPVFSKPSYEAVIAENSPVGTSFYKVLATDKDLDESGTVEYSLVSIDDDAEFFGITADTGLLFVARTLAGRGRRDPYALTVRAMDKGLPPLFSEARVALYVSDVAVNDGVPYISKPASGEIAYVAENAIPGTPVYQVVASDPDDPRSNNGRLIYSLFDDFDKFKIDSESGLITSLVELDREERDTYILVVVVKDSGTPQQLTSKDLIVRVSDVDDHDPIFPALFKKGPVVIRVEEEKPLGSVVGKIRCVDQDVGRNAEIIYRIIGGSGSEMVQVNSTKDGTGLLVLKSRLDRELMQETFVAVHCLKNSSNVGIQWKAYDPNEPSHALLHIIVEDIDDNPPRFVNRNYTLGVHPTIRQFSEVLRVKATDVDSAAEPISYELTNTLYINLNTGEERNVTGVFSLEGKDEILTATDFSKFSGGMFELTIVARNGESESQMDTATVKIYVMPEVKLLKFIFKESPREVQTSLAEFRQDLEAAIEVPVALNLFGAEYLKGEDELVDTTKTSTCFHVIGQDGEVYEMENAKFLLDSARLETVRPVYNKYKVSGIEKCAVEKLGKKTHWVEIGIVLVGGLIAFTALVSSLTICCLCSSYKKRQKKLEYERMQQPVYNVTNDVYGVRSPSIAPSMMSGDPRLGFDVLPDPTLHPSGFSHA
ncbi:unnamed protein product [Notodromas monacha]|uniref:Cadherin domain-containing protein n=1 Tax=Notodromas monacha TaxID=399045 RepID=A0A7R9BHX9_9CRUS|nr:unnamed protein product [Notodromas monacha]CAG0914761.1 unnamed protein product [Notodromas monacha]